MKSGGGGGGNASSVRVEPNIKFCTVSMAISWLYSGGAMPGRRPGSGVGQYNAESPKQDSKMFSCQVSQYTLPLWVLLIYA